MAWSDETHVEVARKVYAENFRLAKEILNVDVPLATFYIWLKVDNALEFTQRLYKDFNVKVLPGEFLARDDAKQENPGKGYVRIALVEESGRTKDALLRMKEALK